MTASMALQRWSFVNCVELLSLARRHVPRVYSFVDEGQELKPLCIVFVLWPTKSWGVRSGVPKRSENAFY